MRRHMTSKDFKGSIFVEFENQETAERVCYAIACCDAAHLPEGRSYACVLFLDMHHWVTTGQDLTRTSLHLKQHSCRFAAWDWYMSIMVVLLSVCQVQPELRVVCRS